MTPPKLYRIDVDEPGAGLVAGDYIADHGDRVSIIRAVDRDRVPWAKLRPVIAHHPLALQPTG
jgi:hypothetical protein